MTNEADAVSAAARIGYPVVLKLDSPDLLHKTEAGAVRLNLAGPEDVVQAYRDIMSNVPVGVRVNGVLVQEMVAGQWR